MSISLSADLPGDLRELARLWRLQGRPAVVVEVAGTRGSVPREVGARMLVAQDVVQGSVGGGHLEWQAQDVARALLRSEGAAGEEEAPGGLGWLTRQGAFWEQRLALGPSLGQCCGGVVTLRYTRLADTDPAQWPEPAPRFTLQLYGAGHVGRAVVQLLSGLPCRLNWIDAREAAFPGTPVPSPQVQRICTEAPEHEVTLAPPGAFHLVMTHDHDLDLSICLAVCRRMMRQPDAAQGVGWFGLIGSRSKRTRFEHRLLERGVPPEVLARLVCPIGLPGIAGKEPAVIAVAVVAQLLQAVSDVSPLPAR